MAGYKLYPPSIEGTVPAFIEGAGIISVPFSMNKAVSFSEISGFFLKVKSLNGRFITTLESKRYTNTEVKFVVSPGTFKAGQYYKLQLAYCSARSDSFGEPGYYSTVGVIKCTTKPEVRIDGLGTGNIANYFSYDYMGIYSQDPSNGDASEKMYSGRFVFYDENNQILKDSGELLHKTYNDSSSTEAFEEYHLDRKFDVDKVYVQFIVKTSNGLEVKSDKYILTEQGLVDLDNCEVKATNDFDNGYVKVEIKALSGTYSVLRCEKYRQLNDNKEEEKFDGWVIIKKIDIRESEEDKIIEFLDYTCEQGKIYKYGIQQYNENQNLSKIAESNEVYSDFEDMFLWDGERQLKVRFNPKVPSYKPIIQESKTDTIGSKYPFFSRNANVNYREFTLSGLISYLMDDNRLFMTNQELWLEDDKIHRHTSFYEGEKSNKISIHEKMEDRGKSLASAAQSPSSQPEGDKKDSKQQYIRKPHDLVSANIFSERVFKNAVIDWLSDGKKKVLKTPTEGNFLVRLMGVSTTPTDTLGRMLHTFTCTASEVGECTLTNLINLNLVNTNAPEDVYEIKTVTITKENYKQFATSEAGDYITLEPVGCQFFKVIDLMPGSIIRINDQEIMIGATGAYFYEDEIMGVNKIEIPKRLFEDNFSLPEMTYQYKVYDNTANQGYRYINHTIGVRQFYCNNKEGRKEIISYLNHKDKFEVIKINTLKLLRRDIHIGNNGIPTYINISDEKELNKYNFTASIAYGNNESTIIDLSEKEVKVFYVSDLEDITSINLGNGIMAEMGYIIKETLYDAESVDLECYNARNSYISNMSNDESFEAYISLLKNKKILIE